MCENIELHFDERDTPLSMPLCTITRDDDIEDGEPVLLGVRVSKFYQLVEFGFSLDQIAKQYPKINRNYIVAAIRYAYAKEGEMEEYLRKSDGV